MNGNKTLWKRPAVFSVLWKRASGVQGIPMPISLLQFAYHLCIAINHRETLRPMLDRALRDPRAEALVVPIGKGELVCRKA